MTSDERALQYLADANPIPDPKKLGQRASDLVDLPATRRRRLMDTEERTLRSAPEPRRFRPRWAVAFAAAVVVAAAGVGSWFLFAGDGGDRHVHDGGVHDDDRHPQGEDHQPPPTASRMCSVHEEGG